MTSAMNWKQFRANITGTVDEEILVNISCRERLGGTLKFYHRSAA